MNQWLLAAVVLTVCLLPCVAVCFFSGPLAGLAALEVASALTTAVLMLLAESFRRQPFIDLAVVFGYKRTQLPDALSGVNTTLAGVKVSIPLMDRNQGNRAAASAELRRQEQLREEAETGVRTDFERAAQEFEMRRAEVVDTLQPLREHARTIADIAQAAYQQGGVELLRLLDAERSRLDAESAWVEGMVAFQQSVVNLEAAQGVSR